MIEELRQRAGELLATKKVTCVLGYERGTDGVIARPAFVYQPEGVERLVFDNTCVHNLAKYLLDRKSKPTAIVAKPCDARAVNLLLQESQIKREDIFILGIACTGVTQSQWGRPSQELQPKCHSCTQHTPPIYDVLFGTPVEEKEPPVAQGEDIAKMEAKSLAERAAFWKAQSERCFRCYGCRQVCPGCYCWECFADRTDPEWLGINVAPSENEMWHIIRAYHLGGRCIDCGECQRVCPVNIPLMLLNHKLGQEVERFFHYQAGLSAEVKAPLHTFDKEETLGISK